MMKFGVIRRRQLRSAINKRRCEKQKLEKDWYIIYRIIDNNVCKKKKKILTTQENYTFHQ